MYEGETFSQMFKRTKRCCAKLLRKISFNTTPSRAPTKIGENTSTKYIQQKDGVEQISSEPQNFPKNQYTSRRKSVILSNFTDNVCCEESEHQTFRISPRLFASQSTSYVRVEDNSSQNDSHASASKAKPTQLMGSMLSKYITKQSNPCNHNTSSFQDGDIILTDKDICIGANGEGKGGNIHNLVTRQAINSLVTSKPGYTSTSGSTWSNNKNETTTSFIVAQNLIEKFDSCLNLAAHNLRNSLSPKISIYNNHVETGKFCHTVEFNILKEDASDTISYHAEYDDYNIEQVIFEKVKYDKSKKYLRHTPSSSSTGSSASSPKTPCSSTLISIDRMHSTFSLDDGLLVEEFPPSHLPPTETQCSAGVPNDPNGNFQYDLEGNQHVSSLPSRYCFQHDGNGNSYGSNKILFDDPWDMFDNKVNKARDKKLLLLRQDDYFRGSPKSSSTTLETWVDDEVFDNSFNEEIERRHIPLLDR